MRWQRLGMLVVIACVVALPEALVRHEDPGVGFQTWMVLQLLGVIVAAIGVAAVASVLGVMALRVAITPVRDRPATFVAWSFLRAQTISDPMPLRFGRWVRGVVDADPLLPQRGKISLKVLFGGIAIGLAVVGGLLLRQMIVTGQPVLEPRGLLLRNISVAVAVHGLLLLSSALPWRRARLLLPVLFGGCALLALFIGAFHPLVAPFVHGPTLAAVGGLSLLGVFIIIGRPRHHRIRFGKGAWARLWALLIGVLVVLAVFTARLPNPVAWYTAEVIGVATALYLLAQAQPKVTLPVFVSIVGVAAGTWALIVVLSVMGGFAADLRGKMLVANAHALVERPGRAHALPDAYRVASAIRQVQGVAGVSPQVRGDAIVSSSFNVNNFVSLRGIDPDLAEVKRELGSTVVTGSLRLLAEPDRIGRDSWRVRRPQESGADLPNTPTALQANTSDDANKPTDGGDLDALLQLAPGPHTPPPPQIVGDHEPMMLPSDPMMLPSGGAPAPDPAAVIRGTDEEEAELKARDLELDIDDARVTMDLPWAAVGGDVMAPVAPGIMLGAELSRSLQVELGDRIEVITPDADVGPMGMRPRIRTFRVAGTFETGLYDADSKVAYVTLEQASRYFNLDGRANVIEVRLTHPKEPDAAIARIRTAVTSAGAPSDVEILDWRALNRSLFSALAFERLVIFLVLALIILVASFAIVSALTMVILQKRNGIAMLQAMGASRLSVRSAFVQMGGVIGAIGTAAGLALGVSTCLLIQELGIKLPEAYYVRTLPVAIDPYEIGAVVVASLLISLVATVFPAKSAARLSPLEGLRYE